MGVRTHCSSFSRGFGGFQSVHDVHPFLGYVGNCSSYYGKMIYALLTFSVIFNILQLVLAQWAENRLKERDEIIRGYKRLLNPK